MVNMHLTFDELSAASSSVVAALAIIGGYLGVKSANRNALKLAQIQRVQQESIERRQVRRDAYLKFLNHVGVMEQRIEDIWQWAPPDDSEIGVVAKPILDSLNEAHGILNLLMLEGPPAVHAAAEELVRHLGGRIQQASHGCQNM
jgi:hypothetical protein